MASPFDIIELSRHDAALLTIAAARSLDGAIDLGDIDTAREVNAIAGVVSRVTLQLTADAPQLST